MASVRRNNSSGNGRGIQKAALSGSPQEKRRQTGSLTKSDSHLWLPWARLRHKGSLTRTVGKEPLSELADRGVLPYSRYWMVEEDVKS